MAEEATSAAPAKKKSKLPIILVLVLVLGGGGFFAMKMRGGKPKVEIKLGKEKPAELKEFLINLRDQGVYCRIEVALGLAEGAKPTLIDEHEAAVRDAINLRVMSKRLQDVNTVEGLKQLKRDIASDLNKILAEPKEEKKPDDANADDTKSDDDSSDSKDGKDSKEDKDSKAKAAKAKATKEATDTKSADDAAPKPPTHPDWDSDTGPVLKVYFSSFATQ